MCMIPKTSRIMGRWEEYFHSIPPIFFGNPEKKGKKKYGPPKEKKKYVDPPNFFLIKTFMVLVALSAHNERFSVSCMWDSEIKSK